MKVDNSQGAIRTKIALRENVLERARPAHVLDCFAGLVGEMHKAVWHLADSYVGIDQVWSIQDTRLRFVGDNEVILRSIDLGRYNIFDLDAYGSPWVLMVILAERRSWKRGERGAVVLTDGEVQHGRWGSADRGISNFIGVARHHIVGGDEGAVVRGRIALRAWVERCGVKPIEYRSRVMSARERMAKGACEMVYSSLVFEGR